MNSLSLVMFLVWAIFSFSLSFFLTHLVGVWHTFFGYASFIFFFVQPIPKTLQGKENSYKGVLILHPPKISTNLHILIKAYDLFLLWNGSLTQQNMRRKFAIISSIPTDLPKGSHQKQGGKRKAHKKKSLVRNESHLSDPRDHPRNLRNFFSETL